MRKAIAIFSIMVFSIFSAVISGATSYDYGDAPMVYEAGDAARHATPEWQKLGSAWDKEEQLQDRVNQDNDDGVFWSTDGGATWNNWGNSTLNLTQGDTVQFKFAFTRALYGKHPYDDLGVWLDLNGDGDWSDMGEEIYYERWFKGSTQVADDTYFASGGSRYDSETSYFITGNILIGTGFSGETWLRARVACSESINGVTGTYNPNDERNLITMSANGYLWQGETEDYRLNVSTVPIPGAIWLLGSGLVGLIGVRRRKKA